jgi:hypothetical protein
MDLKQMVLDIQIADNLGLKYMYYNTYRPNAPKSRKVHLPFFGICNVHKIKQNKNKEFRLTVRVSIAKAKDSVIHIAQHIAKMDKPTTKNCITKNCITV